MESGSKRVVARYMEQIMVTDNFLAIGTKIAQFGNVKKARMSAIAFTKSGRIIAHASNRRVMGQQNKFSLHAEEALLMKLEKLHAFQRFDNISIFVMRINKLGIAMARPCRKCARLLDRYPVTVFYTDIDGQIKEF